MKIDVIGFGSLLATVVGVLFTVREGSWRRIARRRIERYLMYSRDLNCERQREMYAKKATRAVWFAHALGRFKDRRRFGLAMAAFAVVASLYLVVTFPLLAARSYFAVQFSLWVVFVAAGVNVAHVMYCMSIGHVNRVMFTAVGGREALPILEAPALFSWIWSLRIRANRATPPSAFRWLQRAAEMQRQDGGAYLPQLTSLQMAHDYGHLLEDEYIRRAIESLRRDRQLGCAILRVNPLLNAT